MADHNWIYILLLLLSLSVLLNLQLTLKMYLRVKELPGFYSQAPAPQPGEQLPLVQGKNLQTGVATALWHPQNATVLVFLSSRCPKCRQKLQRLAQLNLLTAQSGVQLLLLSSEPGWRFKKFLMHSNLLAQTVKMTSRDYLQLNPLQLSPAYLFVDQQGQVQAAGMIDDDNWLAFEAQLQDIHPDAEQAA